MFDYENTTTEKPWKQYEYVNMEEAIFFKAAAGPQSSN